MTKAGVIHFTRYMAVRLASSGVRVNCISPGGVFNRQERSFVKNYIHRTPLGRMADETQALRDRIRAVLPPEELRRWEALEALAPGERTREQAQLHARLSAKGLAAP